MIRKTKKILIGLMVVLLAFCCVVGMAFGMTGCSDAADTKGIQSTAINENGELVVTYTDGTSENLGVVVGSDGTAKVWEYKAQNEKDWNYTQSVQAAEGDVVYVIFFTATGNAGLAQGSLNIAITEAQA